MCELKDLTLQRFNLNKCFIKIFYLIIFILLIICINYEISLFNLNDYKFLINRHKHIKNNNDLYQYLKFTKLNFTEHEIIRKTGFNVILSRSLPYNRSLPDVRHETCKSKTYSKDLPKVSIIIIYYNEEISTLLRTLYSIVKRTPPNLLQEILLVNDFSENAMQQQIFVEEYLRDNFPNLIKIENLKQRHGLIRARMIGATIAQAPVLIFLDAHIEVNVDWLPPLLEPLQQNDSAICTTPVIDIIRYDTLVYEQSAPSRGAFNWDFNYINLPLLPDELKDLPNPHNNPVMNGGLFAIRRDYFWHLKGYDTGLEIWGAEQFELSFKIWMCGGKILEISCSRVGHLYRSPTYHIKYSDRKDDFISKNYKRVAEVWMDEYKEYLYEHIPKLTQIDEGELKDLKLNRKALQCKSFKWFLHNIVPDLLKVYPPVEPNDYAQGAIQSLALPNLCLDTEGHKAHERLIFALRSCSPDLKYPYATQQWKLSFRKDIRQQGLCLEVQNSSSITNASLWLWNCHNLGGNQYWYYDPNTQLLRHGAVKHQQKCLDVLPDSLAVVLNSCDQFKKSMKWHFGYINQTAMEKFFQ